MANVIKDETYFFFPHILELHLYYLLVFPIIAIETYVIIIIITKYFSVSHNFNINCAKKAYNFIIK